METVSYSDARDNLNAMIEEYRRHPFKGASKSEPLGSNLFGWLSRRIG